MGRAERLTTWSVPASRTARPRAEVLCIREFLDAFFTKVAQARRRVLVECFIVRDDVLGRALADALAAAAARGLDVRLLYDPMGSRATPNAFFGALRARGVRVRSYGDIGVILGRFRLKARNHSRLVVVDDMAFTGGQAWGKEWLPRDQGGDGWHDVCCRVQGPLVEDFVRLFDQRWAEAVDSQDSHGYDTGDSHPGLRLVSDAPGRESRVLHEHLRVIRAASKRVWLANAYCFPPKRLLRALAGAARRGVDVRVLLPAESDIPIVRRAARHEYRDWMDNGITVWEYQHRVLHAKYAVADDWCFVGSFNANASSLKLSIEIGVIGCEPAFVGAVAARFEDDLENSVGVTRESLQRRGPRDRMLDVLCNGLMAMADGLLDRVPAASD